MKDFKLLFLWIALMVNGVISSSEDIKSPETIKSPEDIIKQMRIDSFEALRKLCNECQYISKEEGYVRLQMIMNVYNPVWVNARPEEKDEIDREKADFYSKTDKDGNDIVMVLLNKASESKNNAPFCLEMAMNFYRFQKEKQSRLNEK